MTFPDVNFVPDPFLYQGTIGPKSICTHCPVKTICRDQREGLGVWGGEDEADYLIRTHDTHDRNCTACGAQASVIDSAIGEVCTACVAVS